MIIMSHDVAKCVKCQKPTVTFLGKSVYVLGCSVVKTITRGAMMDRCMRPTTVIVKAERLFRDFQDILFRGCSCKVY